MVRLFSRLEGIDGKAEDPCRGLFRLGERARRPRPSPEGGPGVKASRIVDCRLHPFSGEECTQTVPPSASYPYRILVVDVMKGGGGCRKPGRIGEFPVAHCGNGPTT